MHATTGYKAKAGSNGFLPNEHNVLYVHFEQKISGGMSLALPVSSPSVSTVTAAEIRSALLRVNQRKATGPDGLAGRVVGAYADQLAVIHGHF